MGFIWVNYINLDKIWGGYCTALSDSYKKYLLTPITSVHICTLFVCRCSKCKINRLCSRHSIIYEFQWQNSTLPPGSVGLKLNQHIGQLCTFKPAQTSESCRFSRGAIRGPYFVYIPVLRGLKSSFFDNFFENLPFFDLK